MSRKNVLPAYNVITAGDMSLASLTSLPTNIQFLDNVCFQLVWTGTPTGTFSIQGSLTHQQDSLGNVSNVGTWDNISLSPAPVAVGSAGDILIDMNQLSFPWIRVVYTKTSGTGTLTATVGGKML